MTSLLHFQETFLKEKKKKSQKTENVNKDLVEENRRRQSRCHLFPLFSLVVLLFNDPV